MALTCSKATRSSHVLAFDGSQARAVPVPLVDCLLLALRDLYPGKMTTFHKPFSLPYVSDTEAPQGQCSK
jgi:hypothetical protein